MVEWRVYALDQGPIGAGAPGFARDSSHARAPGHQGRNDAGPRAAVTSRHGGVPALEAARRGLLQGVHASAGAATIAAIWRSEVFGDDSNCRPNSTANGSGRMSSWPASTPSRIADATSRAEALGTSSSRLISVSTGPG